MPRVLIAAVAALLFAAPARAGVVAAEDVLPAGQSGYVSLLGVTSGEGSPHLYDQVPLFTSFRWKPHTFNQPGDTEVPRAGVSIVRDAYGVPAITGGSENDAWWGVGWAVAEDRLFQLELFRRATTGRLAEILGRDYLDDDLIARRDYYTRPELEKMFAAIPPQLQARAAAYRDGVNAYIAYLRTHPDRIPGEFAALQVPLTDFQLYEQAAIGVFLARTVPSGDGNELTNLRLLRENGRDALDALAPIRQKRETYTVPPREGRFASQPGRTRKQEKAAFRRSLKVSADWELPSAKAATRARAAVAVGLPGHVGGSSMFAIRDRRTKHAYLFNGPQLGFSEPELFVEFELHYPGLDLRGVSAAGIPVMGIGHNGSMAWGFTSGLSDEDDLYAEQLDGAEKYRFKGSERAMDCRDEAFAYRTPAIDVAGGATPESGTAGERICRTVHGPVQVRAGRSAYARRYAIWGRELETIVGIDRLNRARTVKEVDTALREVTWNENVMAADSQGNIGYWHPGLHQLRPKGFDERLPYPGTGEAEWRGLRDRATDPHVINPRQGWLANWNNLPAKGWTTGDAESSERLAGPFHRAQFLQRAVRALAEKPSIRGAQTLISHVGTTAQQRPLAEVRLRRAASGARGRARDVLAAIRAWDGSYHRVDDAGTVDPGVALWEELKDRLEDIALAKLGPGRASMDALVSNPGSSHQFDISDGEAYAVRTLSPREWRRAAETTAVNLEKKFGTADIAKWREPRRMYEWAIQNAGSPPPLPFFDRGTWEQFVELGPG
jgi:penicillin amidase